eukprot:Blabericola_migrator_1__12989@NODE_865_length_6229_cov_246_540571_g613_i0_p1_GENE_NODE_865_length_6229_cov_246_540571_g613_i0NODE_865_length_6229_cov_246_540571_g613_i0_p1_ORF_typecomplete_len531_score44_92Pkinase/PF00069_25/1_9e40Pkinase_Tyr/PF07714_17/2_2e27Kinaselike/PF14531_6/1_3e03Kinaselike/PF14531_6/8_7e08Kdo/PF06293_14/7_5e07Pkinase_fungal/PF17667_1/6_6e06WaaY/PF06176_11/3_2e05RIO1/PF01163_22/0_00044APH/PF01636_23/0_15APH/PF01636_23/2_4e02FTA2/PF13095_6/2_7e03FTA2/PF13095_6/0_045_NODE_86
MVVTRSHAQSSFQYTSRKPSDRSPASKDDTPPSPFKKNGAADVPQRHSVSSVYSDTLGTTASSGTCHNEEHQNQKRDVDTGSTQSESANNSNQIEDNICYAVPKSVEDIVRGLPNPLPNDIPIIKKRKTVFEDYEILKEIGSGTYAKVFMLKHKTSRIISAGKFLKPHRFPSNTEKRVVQMFINEIHLLAKTQCPGTVTMNSVSWAADGVLLDLEYVEGGTMWREKVCPSTEARWKHLVQLLQAVEFIHSKGVVHRDLKPTNILRGPNCTLKIADFGWAEELSKLHPSTGEWPGTLEINPPEVLNFTGPLTERIDNYAVGMNFLLFVSNRFVCRQKGLNVNVAVPVILKMVENLRKTHRPPVNFTTETWEIFLGLTDPSPTRRWTLQQVYHHPWVVRHYLQYANAEGPDLKGLLWLNSARRTLEAFRVPRSLTPQLAAPPSPWTQTAGSPLRSTLIPGNSRPRSLLHRVLHAPRTIFDWTAEQQSATQANCGHCLNLTTHFTNNKSLADQTPRGLAPRESTPDASGWPTD